MPDLRAGLAESGVGLFNQMLNRRRTPPDCNTYDTLISLMLEVGAPGQALHLHQLKMQQVRCSHTEQKINKNKDESMPAQQS